MNKSLIALLALVLAAPAVAQDEPAAEQAPAAEEAPAEEAPADEAPAEEAPAEEAPAEEAAVTEEEAAGEEAAADEGSSEPWVLYFGADYVNTRLSVSAPPSAPAAEFDSSMVRVRAGMDILKNIGFELHYGIDQADEAAGEVTTDAYYGAFIVPTAKAFEVLELAFPVGYARSEFDDSGEALGSIAYGIDVEIPVKGIWSALPDVRLTGGWMVYYQKSDARVYGANFGLRYDFSF